MVASVILVEAHPRVADNGQPVAVRLAGGGAAQPYFYDGHHWRAGLAPLPKSVQSLDFDGVRLGGGGSAAAVQIAWQPASKAALAELAALFWLDAPVTVRVGPEGDALPPIETSGLILAAPCEGGALQIAIADRATDLKRPLLVDRYAGTGGIEGPQEWAGTIKPRAWGPCFNVRGRLIDKAANVWIFGDPARQWRAFDAVRDRGVPAEAAQMTLLAWQGSPAATFAALRAAAAPADGGVLAPSIAAVKWWTRPSGDLYADIRGEIDGGYVETAVEIVARLVAARSALTFGAGEVAAATAVRPAPIGLLVDSESTTTASVISDLLAQVSLSWMLDGDAIAFRRWEWTAPVRVARSHRVTRREVMKPVASRRLGWRRNWGPMGRSDIAVSVLEGTATYADGTPLDDLKPAQPGATAGAPDGSTVGGTVQPDGTVAGGRLAEEVNRLADLNGLNILGSLASTANLSALIDARTMLAGKAVGTVLVETTDQLDSDVRSLAGTILLLGAKNAAGTAFIVDADAVEVTGTGLAARTLTALTATIDGHDADITDFREILFDKDGTTLRAVNILDLDGNITGTVNTLTGKESDYAIFANVFRIVNPNGGQPFTPFSIGDDGTVEMLSVRVKTLAYEALVPLFAGENNRLDPMSGFQVLPGGLIVQWGRIRASISSEVTFSVTFPKAFPGGVMSVGATPYITTFSISRDLWVQNVGVPSVNGATFGTQAADANAQALDGIDWFAFGY